MENNKESKIKVSSNYKDSKNNDNLRVLKKINKNKSSSLNKIQSLKQIKNKINYNDPFKQKIWKKITKSKSRQSIFAKSQYLFFGKEENDIKTNSTLKSAKEMENKFYIRNKEGLKRENHTDSLYKILLKKLPVKSSQKIIITQNINQNKNRKIPDSLRKLSSKKINNLIVSKKSKINGDNNRLSFLMPNISSTNDSKTNKSSSCSKMINLKNDKNLNIETIANYNIRKIKKILKKRIKINSKILSNSIINLGKNNSSYQIINKSISNKKIWQKIYINQTNLSRLIDVTKTVREGFYEDDINNIKQIKRFSRNSKYNKFHLIPKSVKINHFSRSTISRFNQCHGNYFGIPV